MISELRKVIKKLDLTLDDLMKSLGLCGKEISVNDSYEVKTNNIIKFENTFNELLFDLKVYYVEDVYKLITAFISQIYEDYLIQLEKYINGWNAFSKRKAKSLTLWSERNNKDKIIEIN